MNATVVEDFLNSYKMCNPNYLAFPNSSRFVNNGTTCENLVS